MSLKKLSHQQEIQLMRDLVYSKMSVRALAKKYGISPASVAERRISHNSIKSRQDALLEREFTIFQLVFKKCLEAINSGQEVPTTKVLKQEIGPVLSRAGFGTVTQDFIGRVLRTFEQRGIIPARKRHIPKPTPLTKADFEIAAAIKKDPRLSNNALMQRFGLTRNVLNLRLRKMRDAGMIPERKRPGGKPLNKRRNAHRRGA